VSGQRGGESDQLPVTTLFEASIWGRGDGNKLLRNTNEHEQPWPMELALARGRGGDGLGISWWGSYGVGSSHLMMNQAGIAPHWRSTRWQRSSRDG
jgi:hypothetical protein